MDAKEAQRLRRESFGKPCSHSQIEKEEQQGREMYVYACLTCGSEFVSREIWEKIIRTRKASIDQHSCSLL